MWRLSSQLKTSLPFMVALLVGLGPLLAAAQQPDPQARPAATAKAEIAPEPAAAASTLPATPANKPAAAGDSVATAKRAGEGPASDQPEETGLTPEQYYQLVIERQRLEISSNKQILVILDAHGNDPLKARADLQKHEEERAAKNDALFQKYGVSADEYYRSSRGTEEQALRAKYLNAHDEIRDQIAAGSKELRVLEKEVWRKLMPAWTPPPGKSVHQNGGVQRGP